MDVNIKLEPDYDVPVLNSTSDSEVTSVNITDNIIKIEIEEVQLRSGLIKEEQIDLPDSSNETSDDVRGSRTILESEETNSTMDRNIKLEPDDDVPVHNPTSDSDVTSVNITDDMIKIEIEEVQFRSGLIKEEQIDLPDSCNETSDVVRGSRTILESEETNSTMDKNIIFEPDNDVPVRTDFTSNEKLMVVNVHKYVKQTWPNDEDPNKESIIEKTASIVGIGVACVYRIIEEYATTGDVQRPTTTRKASKKKAGSTKTTS